MYLEMPFGLNAEKKELYQKWKLRETDFLRFLLSVSLFLPKRYE